MSTAAESKKVESAKSALELLEEDDEFEVKSLRAMLSWLCVRHRITCHP